MYFTFSGSISPGANTILVRELSLHNLTSAVIPVVSVMLLVAIIACAPPVQPPVGIAKDSEYCLSM